MFQLQSLLQDMFMSHPNYHQQICQYVATLTRYYMDMHRISQGHPTEAFIENDGGDDMYNGGGIVRVIESRIEGSRVWYRFMRAMEDSEWYEAGNCVCYANLLLQFHYENPDQPAPVGLVDRK